MRRNLTIQLDEDVIREAKTIAEHRGMSVSGLVAQQIRHLAVEHDRYEQAKRGALALLDAIERTAEEAQSVDTPSQRSWRREDIYEERLGRYGR
jgi:antitoxin component of RelBE/YafQ-DinJ toxin-antitoxin module